VNYKETPEINGRKLITVEPSDLVFILPGGQTLQTRAQYCAITSTADVKLARCLADLLEAIASVQNPLRPGRKEPRAMKRRPKSYQLLTRPRRQFQEIPHRAAA
jgi:hypothetical protein